MKNAAIHLRITRSFAPATVWGLVGGLTLALTNALRADTAYDDLIVDGSTNNPFTVERTLDPFTGEVIGITANNVYVGQTSMGTVNELGGSLSVNTGGKLYLGYGAGSFGTYNLTPTGDDLNPPKGSAVIVTTLTTPSTEVGVDGLGIFNQTGGIHATDSLDLAVNSDGTGGYNLSGGTLDATNGKGAMLGTSITFGSGMGVFDLNGGNVFLNHVVVGSGTSIFNLNGGTLTAGASDHYTSSGSALPFLGGLTALNVGGGATIDTQAYNVTVTQPLVHSPYGTVSYILLRPNGSGYTSAPTVTLTGGGGFGATAVASINASGQVTGITLTSTGFDYTSAPTATFTGGGGSGAFATMDLIKNSGDGGVVKNGTGTLNLLASNTFNGPLVVNAGTVVAPNNGSALSPSEVRLGSAGTVNLSADSGVTFTQRGTTFDGAGRLEKSGAGTLYFGGGGTVNVSLSSGGVIDVEGGTLYGSTSYGGVYTNNKGSLNIAAGATFDGVEADVRVDALTGAGTLSGGYNNGSANVGSLTVGVANGSGTFAGVIQNDAGSVLTLTKIGTGTQTLSGANTFTGSTTVQGGGLTLGNQYALQNSALTLNSGTTLTFDSGETANAFTVAGLSGAVDIVLANNATTPVGITLTVGSNNADSTYSGLLSGPGSLTKAGTGTLTLTGTNSYTGGTTISAGVLQIDTGGTSGSLGSGNVVDNAALVFNRADTATVPNVINGTGSVTQLGSGTLLLSGSNNFMGGVSLQAGVLAVGSSTALGTGDLSVAGTGGTLSASGGDRTLRNFVDLGAGATLTLAPLPGDAHGLIFRDAINGAGSLVVSGSTVTLASADNFTGGLTLNGGAQLLVGNDTALGAGSVSVGGTGGTLAAYSADHTVSNALAIGAGATLTLSTDPASGAHNLTFNGVISGPGSLVQNAGTQTLSASNTYLGGTTVSAGTLIESNNGNALSSGVVAIGAGATVALRNTTGSTISQEGITFTGTGTIQKTGTGTLSLGGPGSVNVSLSSGGVIDVEGGILAGSGNYNGRYTNNSGSLNIASGATFDGVEGTVRVDALTGAGTLSGGYLSGSTNVGSVTIGVANGSGTFAGTMQDDPSSGGKLTLIKIGAGTEIFTGNSTSAGTVTISAGTLQVGGGGTSGSLGSGNVVDNAALVFNRADTATVPNVINGTGSVTQNGSGTLALDGANTFSGGVNLATGTLAVGSNTALGSGSLSVGGASGTLYATGADRTLSNAVNIGAGTTLTLTSVGGDVHNLTLNGIISGAGTLVKNGTGTVTLGGNNTFTGTVSLAGGTLAIANDGDLGTAASVLNLVAGHLLYTNDATTTRTFNLNNAVTLSPAAGKTLTFGSGANVNGGFLGTGGTYVFGDGSNLNGTTTALGSTVMASGTTAAFTNATLHGAVTQAGGTLAVTDTVLSSAGTLAVGGTINASGLESDGVINITSGGVLANTGTPLVLGGGSRTTVNAGTLSTSGTTIELNGGLLVLTNNGTQTGTLDVNYGSTAKGTNFGTVNVTDGGKFGTNTASSSMTASMVSGLRAGTALNPAAYTSFVGPQLQVMPSSVVVGSLSLGSGSSLVCNVADAQGAAGSGYDTVNVQGALTLSRSSTPGNQITIDLGSLTSNGMNGAAANFDASHAYVFTVATANSGITGFDPSEFFVDTNGFQNSLGGGHFSVVESGNTLDLDFTPVPEPATWLAGALVLGVAGMGVCRRLHAGRDPAGH